jgi:hypothetical protein
MPVRLYPLPTFVITLSKTICWCDPMFEIVFVRLAENATVIFSLHGKSKNNLNSTSRVLMNVRGPIKKVKRKYAYFVSTLTYLIRSHYIFVKIMLLILCQINSLFNCVEIFFSALKLPHCLTRDPTAQHICIFSSNIDIFYKMTLYFWLKLCQINIHFKYVYIKTTSWYNSLKKFWFITSILLKKGNSKKWNIQFDGANCEC